MIKYVYIIVVAFCISSCFNEPIELDLNEGNESIAIAAWISDLDEEQFVTISKTINFLGNNNPINITDALVILSDSNQEYSLEHRAEGRYYLPDGFQGRVGDLYKLEVMYEGQEYTAEHIMRPCPAIESVGFELDTEADRTDSLDQFLVTFSFQEMPGSGDAYFGIDYLKRNTVSKYIPFGSFTDDEFIDGVFIENINAGSDRYLLGDTIIVDLYSIGVETSEFLSDIETEFFRDGPFDPPPANIRTNIKGGAVGYFIASGAQRETIIIQ